MSVLLADRSYLSRGCIGVLTDELHKSCSLMLAIITRLSHSHIMYKIFTTIDAKFRVASSTIKNVRQHPR